MANSVSGSVSTHLEAELAGSRLSIMKNRWHTSRFLVPCVLREWTCFCEAGAGQGSVSQSPSHFGCRTKTSGPQLRLPLHRWEMRFKKCCPCSGVTEQPSQGLNPGPPPSTTGTGGHWCCLGVWRDTVPRGVLGPLGQDDKVPLGIAAPSLSWEGSGSK